MGNEIRLNRLVCADPKAYGAYNIIFENGATIGTFEKDGTGYYIYWPSHREGGWSAPPMRAIADLLDHVNAAWDAETQKLLSDSMKYQRTRSDT